MPLRYKESACVITRAEVTSVYVEVVYIAAAQQGRQRRVNIGYRHAELFGLLTVYIHLVTWCTRW